MPFIKLLKKKYDDNFAIEIKNWSLSDDQITLLEGPSGAGKSSVIKLLIGLEVADECEWNLNGESMNLLSPPDRNFSVVFQNYDLFPHMTARENIIFFAKCRNMNEKNYLNDLHELAEYLKIQSILDRYPETLSGGEKQRVALSRALISKPKMIFLDEPFSALDSSNKTNARNLLSGIIKLRKIPCLLVSHDEDDKKVWRSESYTLVGEKIKTIIKSE